MDGPVRKGRRGTGCCDERERQRQAAAGGGGSGNTERSPRTHMRMASNFVQSRCVLRRAAPSAAVV